MELFEQKNFIHPKMMPLRFFSFREPKLFKNGLKFVIPLCAVLLLIVKHCNRQADKHTPKIISTKSRQQTMD